MPIQDRSCSRVFSSKPGSAQVKDFETFNLEYHQAATWKQST